MSMQFVAALNALKLRVEQLEKRLLELESKGSDKNRQILTLPKKVQNG